jgi:uncharacterized membrane protein
MTETEIRKAMHEAGEKILPILRNFENKTGQRVESIRFQRTNKAATGLEIINYVDVFTRDYP